VTCFPTAADLVMGKPSPVPLGGLHSAIIRAVKP